MSDTFLGFTLGFIAVFMLAAQVISGVEKDNMVEQTKEIDRLLIDQKCRKEKSTDVSITKYMCGHVNDGDYFINTHDVVVNVHKMGD